MSRITSWKRVRLILTRRWCRCFECIILLWCMKGNCVVINTIFQQIWFEYNEFFTIIIVEEFYFGLKTIFNKNFEMSEDDRYIEFVEYWVKPNILCVVINKNEIVSWPINNSVIRSAPNININKINKSMTSKIICAKRLLITLEVAIRISGLSSCRVRL